MFGKQTIVKILVFTVKAALCYSCCLAKMSKSHNKNDRPFLSSCSTTTVDFNSRKRKFQCMNTVLKT